MMDLNRFGRMPIACAALSAILVAGCSSKETPVASASAAPAQTAAAEAREDGWEGRERVTAAMAHLNWGRADEAKRELETALRENPDDGIARNLLAQIDSDPRALLGQENFRYTVKEGDSMSLLAQRFLGSPMKFWALTRYNGLATPVISPGQTILIPGKPKAATPPAAARRPQSPAPQPNRPAQQPQQTARPAPAKPAAPAVNPAQAARLRGQGLAAMNSGAINRAVGLLRQALSLDPGNAAIRNDLNRAVRIQSTVRSR